MWIEEHLELSQMKPGQTKELVYKYDDSIVVTKIDVSCGCTKPNGIEDGILKVIYKAPAIPKHLEYKGEYTTFNKIRLDSDRGKFELSFRVKVKK